MKVEEILKITKGNLFAGRTDTDIEAARISTDSRTIQQGELFLAIKGPNFDANAFAEEAFKKGAIGAILGSRPHEKFNISDKKVVIQVKDTLKALQSIASYHRTRFEIPVIAVTGSNGKTTVKEMIWKILSSRYNVLKNEGTKNNHIGVPQTLLKLKSNHEACVLELGANHKGEIRLLGGISRPSMAVITNIGPSHLEFLKDSKGVFEAKKELLESLADWSIAVLNGDDELLCRISDPRLNIITFGLKGKGDFRATDISVKGGTLGFLLNGKKRFELNLLGRHNVSNALAAIAVASQFGISYGQMRKSLLEFKPADRRLSLRKTPSGINIIDDSYNSNPVSMKHALETLMDYPARSRWVVFGDMLELGKQAKPFHRMIGRIVAGSRIEGFITFGDLSRDTYAEAKNRGMDKYRLWHCRSHGDIAGILRKVLKNGDAVLLKGSRAMRMEEVIKKLKADS